jgi:hypothetical protein
VDEDTVAVSFALEVVLGQGRALVRSIRLLTEQSDLSVETFLAQGLSGMAPARPPPTIMKLGLVFIGNLSRGQRSG